MKSASTRRLYYLQAHHRGLLYRNGPTRHLSRSQRQHVPQQEHKDDATSTRTSSTKEPSTEEEAGALSRRLSEMTEQAMVSAGSKASKFVEESGFSEELKEQLQERIKASSFRSEHASAFAEVNMSAGAGKGSRIVAAAQPWSGTEEQADAVLRMLNDAHKPLKGTPPRIPSPVGPASVVTPPKTSHQRSSGERLANARDRSSVYTLTKDPSLSPEEKAQMRNELKERFTPAARSVPATLQGLASLANERIDDAIARGLFKNLPRGKAIERDYNASSPFLDTTEYFMNKIIQKQEIVPPWIEKQQELVKAVSVFRSRLRADWKRHAARVIASSGGSLDAQIRRAEAYATAEKQVGSFTSNGSSQRAPSEASDSPPNADQSSTRDDSNHAAAPPPFTPPIPFRDPAWEATERAYHSLSITTINSLTRSYNLMAPDLAKKPYFSLDRELLACYRDVAPLLAQEISERARAPPRTATSHHRSGAGGLLDRFTGDTAKVYESTKPHYGLREFLRDWWAGGRTG